MSKESFYFTHDYNARNDDKILELRSRHGAAGYGLFWMVIESMAENEDGGVKASLMGGLSQGFGVAKAFLTDFFKDCIEIGLFYEESGIYYSRRLLTHKEFRRTLSESGKKGAERKWHAKMNGKNISDMKGVEFVEDGSAVKFDDGSIQKLGKGQLLRVKFNDLTPGQVIKGLIE